VTGAAEERASILERLHRDTAGGLLNYFSRRVDSSDDAADLLSETFLVAWRQSAKVPTSDEEARMWMYGVARNVLANWSRGRRRRTALADSLKERLAHSLSASDAPSHEVVDIREAVRALPSNQRELVMLVYWDGFSIVEAGTILGLSESTVRGRHQRARTRLSEALGPSRHLGPLAGFSAKGTT